MGNRGGLTETPRSERRFGLPAPAALLLATAILLSGVLGGDIVRTSRRDGALREAALATGAGALQLDQAIEETVNALDRGTRTDEIVAVTDADARLVPSGAAPESLRTALGSAIARVTAETARDSGEPHVSTPPTPGRPELIVVIARYEAGTTTTTVAERRNAFEHYTIGLLDVGRLVRTAFPGGDDAHVSLEIGGAPLFGDAPADVDVAFTAEGQSWTLGREAATGAGLTPVVVGLTAAALAAAVVIASARAEASLAQARRRADARDRDLALVVDVGGLLQSSLELGEILPSLALRVSDELGLEGTSIALADDDGRLRPAFVLGRQPSALPRSVADVGRPPSTAAAEQEVVVPLERAGRALGALWFVASRPIDADEMRSVLAVAELAGSAITNARAFEREQESRRQLTELDRLKTDFLGTVSHELRTPVAAIKGFAAVMERSWDALDDSTRRDLVSRINRNSGSLDTMLADLLEFARLERRSVHVDVQPTDLGELVRRLLEQSSTLVDAHVLSVRVESRVSASADANAVDRILSNLLTNAAKFSPAGERIDVEVARRNGRAELRVSDQGPGVPESERELIFSRFYRGSSEAAMATRGAGVGLAVVKELADRMGATVSVDDAPGGGARFTVSFAGATAGVTPEYSGGSTP